MNRIVHSVSFKNKTIVQDESKNISMLSHSTMNHPTHRTLFDDISPKGEARAPGKKEQKRCK